MSKLPDAKQRWQELSAAYDALNDPELGMESENSAKTPPLRPTSPQSGWIFLRHLRSSPLAYKNVCVDARCLPEHLSGPFYQRSQLDHA